MIIKRQRQSFRLLLSSSSSSSLILSEHRPLYHHHHWGCSSSSLLMAAAVAVAVAASYSSSLARGGNNHPNFTSSALNPNPNPNPNPIRVLPLNWRASLSMSTTSFDSIHWRRGISIIKGCRCSNNSNVNIIIDNDNDDNNINITSSHTNAAAAASSSLHKPPAFHPPSLPHLLCNSQKSEDNREAKSVSNGTQQNGAYHSIGFPTQPGGKTIVAVDVDEVLGSFLSALNRFIADRYSLNHSVSEYHVYEFFKIWNCSRDEADIRVHEFFKTSYFKTGIRPIPGARQALQKLSRFCNLSVVTSRQNAIKDHTIEWIERHYPGLFQEIHFGNHFALDGQSRPKSDICRSLGADVLIDDNPIYAMECAEVGIRVLLFDYENSYPWCKTASVTQHPLVTKVHNWGEVEHRLVSRTFS